VGLSDYYKKWHLQELVEVPSTFPPPWDAPSWKFCDGREVMGLFRQDQSKETLIAAAQEVNTRGRFACSLYENEDLRHGVVLRCDDVFIRLEGDAMTAPASANVQFKTFVAVVTSRVKDVTEAMNGDEQMMVIP